MTFQQADADAINHNLDQTAPEKFRASSWASSKGISVEVGVAPSFDEVLRLGSGAKILPPAEHHKRSTPVRLAPTVEG